eukprot:TRINITY_DN5574_c0_g5_i1.p1 TRINITY_DN5574_c0_g5~~TRINITY_DN5574_c0_g5_i1.p1  ORF type:complete len:285 (-),score=34.52 TRINITY_DN5574_c0_g5_i1:3-857(-)
MERNNRLYFERLGLLSKVLSAVYGKGTVEASMDYTAIRAAVDEAEDVAKKAKSRPPCPSRLLPDSPATVLRVIGEIRSLHLADSYAELINSFPKPTETDYFNGNHLEINEDTDLDGLISILNTQRATAKEVWITLSKIDCPLDYFSKLTQIISDLSSEIVDMSFKMNFIGASDQQIGPIMNALSRCVNLRSLTLHLRGSNVGDKFLLNLKSKLKSMQNIERVSLTLNGSKLVTVEGIKFLVLQMMEKPDPFQKLELFCDQITGLDSLLAGKTSKVKINPPCTLR